jgi:nucleotide-binding universal stress UspA family protein
LTDATGSEGGLGESHPDQEHRVVVGVDASAESQEALRWAARYARLIGACLDVVHAWHPAEEHAWLQSLPPPAGPTDVARKALAETVATVLYPGPPVVVRTDVIEGHAVKVLTHAAQGADLLVVGDRGFGGFDGLRLGSVSEQCAAHASCSVVIVRSNQS